MAKNNFKCWKKIDKDRWMLKGDGDILAISRLHNTNNKTLGYDVSLNPYGPPTGYKGWRMIKGRKTKAETIKEAFKYMKRNDDC